MITVDVNSYCQECKMFDAKVNKFADPVQGQYRITISCEHEDRCKYLMERFKLDKWEESIVKKAGKGVAYEIRG